MRFYTLAFTFLAIAAVVEGSWFIGNDDESSFFSRITISIKNFVDSVKEKFHGKATKATHAPTSTTPLLKTRESTALTSTLLPTTTENATSTVAAEATNATVEETSSTAIPSTESTAATTEKTEQAMTNSTVPVETKEPEIIIIYEPHERPGFWAMHRHVMVLILVLAIATMALCFAIAIRVCIFTPHDED